jgi:hypothetical protein
VRHGHDGSVTPASGRWPDFFIIGHHKSGTTALYRMLRQHPQIYMPDLKEPRFFASDLPARAPAKRRRHPVTAPEYLALFEAASPEQIAGEASATYLFSHTAADRIAQVNPRARIIAILREPASFLRSLHLTYLRIHFEDETDLRKAIALEQERREGRRIPARSRVPQLLQYSQQVRYAEQLRRYQARFPSEQLLVLIYDDFRRDNETTLRTVLRFLRVDDRFPLPTLDANVTTSSVRSSRVDALLSSVSLARGGWARPVKAAVKLLTPRKARHGALTAVRRRTVVSEVPPPDEELMDELRRRFKPEVVAVSELLGRDLVSLWGYDVIV